MTNIAPTILLVDDFPLNIEILKEALSRYNLLSAADGDEAIALAKGSIKPDLILLDVVMPGLDGYEVCRYLKMNISTKDIPIIFITAQTNSDGIIKGFETGAVDYIVKPFNIMELKARVRTQLAIKMARDRNHRLMSRLESVNKQLTDSIEYAQKIQNASLPKIEFLNEVMPEYFVLLKPRDIVSGDFYWVGKVDSKLVIVAADCTGHGVPGAIMSMFGVAYLNEIVGRKGETTPAEIINELRRIVISSLQQDEKSEVKDGMDISVITIDEAANKIESAGAFNPVYHISKGELSIIPADHMPVSFGEIDQSFINHEVHYNKGDCFYLFSDGFASQFGGSNNKKLMQKGFRSLIMEYSSLPMPEQKQKFDKFFMAWKGANDQIDDVLLLGIRM